ncbi:hypothetical protein D3C77_222810 [compost metagenome]
MLCTFRLQINLTAVWRRLRWFPRRKRDSHRDSEPLKSKSVQRSLNRDNLDSGLIYAVSTGTRMVIVPKLKKLVRPVIPYIARVRLSDLGFADKLSFFATNYAL